MNVSTPGVYKWRQTLLSSCALLILQSVTVGTAHAQAIVASGDVSPYPFPNPQPGPWIEARPLNVGVTGYGELRIEGGAEVTSTAGHIAFYGTSVGVATVTGENSRWDMSGSLIVGNEGDGSLHVENGGSVTNDVGEIGSNVNATGAATVTGAGSIWTTSRDLFVGVDGDATLRVESGGRVTSETGAIGRNASSTSSAIVTGPDSTWTMSSSIFVGNSGDGTLDVENGGGVSSYSAYVGYAALSVGEATITGPGSEWSMSNDLYVGYFGNGKVTAEQDGSIVSTGGYIADRADSTGEVVITGDGSTWQITNTLVVGGNGNAILTIEDGGFVRDAGGLLAYAANTTSTALVSGVGSSWVSTGNLSIGVQGDGALTVENGGTVTAAQITLGDNLGSAGTLNLNGTVDARGAVEASYVRASLGSAALNIDGGILRATGTRPNYIQNFGALSLGSAGLYFDTQSFEVGIATDLSGAGGLTKLGDDGTLTLSGSNTYFGATTVEAGTLRAQTDEALSTNTDMTVNAGATLALNDDLYSSFRSLAGAGDVQLGLNAYLSIGSGSTTPTVFSGRITGGEGSMLSIDDSVLTLTGSSTLDRFDICDCGSLTLTGTAASLTVDGFGIQSGGTFNVMDGAYVHASGMNLYGDTTISGGSEVELEEGILVEGFVPRLFVRDGGILLVHGFAAIEGELPGMAPGALVTGENSRWTVEDDFFLGNYNFGGTGTLQVADKGAVEVLGNLFIGALADQGFDGSHATVSDTGSVLAVDGTIIVGDEDCGCGPTAGSLTVETGGTVAAGSIEIGSLGTLNIGAGDAAGSINTSIIANAGSIIANHTGTARLDAVLTGNGSFTKRGSGVLTYSGDGSAFTGATGVEAGTLLVGSGGFGSLGGNITVGASGTLGGSGTILGTTLVNGTLAAGNSPGTLTFAGDLALGATSTTIFQLSTPGIPGGPTNDFISVGGQLNLGGTLKADVAGAGYYRLFDAGSVSGTFASSEVTGAGGFSVATAAVQYNIPGQVNLSVLGAGQNLQFWDGSNMAGNGTVDGGTGTWNVANTNWTGAPGDAFTNTAWAGSVGVFMGAPGTVTIAGTQSFDTLQFATDGYVLVGGSLAINPVSGSVGTLSTDSGISTTIASVVADGTVSSGLLKIGGGTLILSGSNSYSGGTAINGGTLQVAADASLGAASGGLSLNGGALATTASFDTARSVTLTGAGAFNVGLATTLGLSGTVAGPGGLVKQGFGTLTLSGTSSYTGGTTIQAGTLQVGNGGTTGSIVGNVVNNGALAFNRSDDVVFAGSISGTGYVSKQGAGSLTLTGMSSYSGSTLVNAGTLVLGNSSAAGSGPIALANDTTLAFVDGLNVANAVLVFSDATLSLASGTAALAGPLSGFGTVFFVGDGMLSLAGDSSSFIGTSQVAGILSVNGTLGGTVDVLSGGLLKGTGTVGSLNLASGAAVAPGNSIGTLTVSGDVSFSSGSNYEVEIAGDGTSDRIAASGQAILKGGTVEVIALDPKVSYQDGQRYTILTATGGVTGAFDQAVTDSIFLTVDLEQQANSVDLTIAVQGDGPTPPAVFTSAAATLNQFAVASALGTLPQSGPELGLYNALLFLNSEAEARVAFDQLSGEAYASAKGMFIEQSALLRTAMIDRLRASFGAVAASSAPVMAYAAPSGPAAGEAGMALKAMVAPAVTEKFALWTTGFGSWGEMDGNGNAASLSSSTGGFLIGADATLGAGWRLGITGGYSYTDFDVDGRNSSGDTENWHIGIYGGNQWGPLGLRAGLAYTFQDVEMSRSVAFTGFSDALSSDYDAGTFQAFGELGYRIETAFAAFEPFANVAYVSLHTDGFTENGGAAALNGSSSTTDTSFTTLGLRASKTVLIGDAETTLRGALGWRHAFGDITPLATQSFAGSDAFSIAGTPIAEDAALIEAGFDVLIGTSTTLGVAYTGQFGDGVTQNGFNATLKLSF